MIASEDYMRQKYESKGWIVLKGGWPDFLLTRTESINKKLRRGKRSELHTTIKAVEVKLGASPLSAEQSRVHEILRQAGIPVEVVRVPAEALLAAEASEAAL